MSSAIWGFPLGPALKLYLKNYSGSAYISRTNLGELFQVFEITDQIGTTVCLSCIIYLSSMAFFGLFERYLASRPRFFTA